MVITLKLDKNVKKSGYQSVYFNLVNGKSSTNNQIRKWITTGLEVSAKQFDLKNFRAKSRHPNQEVINQAISKFKEAKRTCETKFDAGTYTIQQVINHLSGGSSVDSVDDYIENVIKETRTYQTYKDYANILGCFKKHLGYDKNRTISFNELSNYTLLSKFKRNMVSTRLSPNTINSYFTKIRVVLNDAYLNQYIFEKFTLHKSLRMAKPPSQPKSCSVEEFVNGLEKCKTLVEVQALGFWLLMFGTRGMYPADIVKIKKSELRDTIGKDSITKTYSFQDKDINNGEEIEWTETKKNFIDDGLNKLIESGVNFLIHTRSKNRNRSNVPMVIRLDTTIYRLFIWLKLSAILTHYNRSEVLGAFDDNLSIFDYNVDSETHQYFWDNLSGHCSKLLGYSFKQARKTFNSQALKLKVTNDVRQVLLGQKNMTMLQYYDDLSVIEDEVNEAHRGVLKAFEFDSLVNLVVDKMESLDGRISLMSPPYGKYVDMLKSNIDWSLIKPPTEPINEDY